MKSYIEPKAKVINLSSEGPLLDGGSFPINNEEGGGNPSNQREHNASNQRLNIWGDM